MSQRVPLRSICSPVTSHSSVSAVARVCCWSQWLEVGSQYLLCDCFSQAAQLRCTNNKTGHLGMIKGTRWEKRQPCSIAASALAVMLPKCSRPALLYCQEHPTLNGAAGSYMMPCPALGKPVFAHKQVQKLELCS